MSGALGWLSYFIVSKPIVSKVVIDCNSKYVDVLYRKVEYVNELLESGNAFSVLKETGLKKEDLETCN